MNETEAERSRAAGTGMGEESGSPRQRPAPRNGVVVASCVLFVAAMAGASYASVPLYRLFCQVTGFGGTTQVANAAPQAASDREVEVRFDANVAPGLPWRFAPEQRAVTVKLGETRLIYYKVTNLGAKAVTATATYNVTPENTGTHFAKMQCFCFTDQTLQPGESLDMPVVFFVDPAMAEDPDARNTRSITLSYTFFAKETGKAGSVASAPAKVAEPGAPL